MTWLLTVFFNKREKALLKKVKEESSDELVAWNFPNLITPFVVVGLSLIAYWLLKQEDKKTFAGFVNLLLNGSLLMFAINRLNSVGIQLFSFDRMKEKKASTDTYNLRVKINEYSKYLIIGIALFYCYQVVYCPFRLSIGVFVQIIITSGIIYFTLLLSKYSFLLQEKIFGRTLGDNIKEETKEATDHLAQKYGE